MNMNIGTLISARNEGAKMWADLYALSARLDRRHEPTAMSPLKRMVARGNVAANMTRDFLETKGAWFNEHKEVPMSVITNNILMRNASRMPVVNPAAIFGGGRPSMEVQT